jgi:putative ABC transport system permease protein
VLRATIAGLLANWLRHGLAAATVVLGVALVTGSFMLTESVQRTVAGQAAASPAGLVVIERADAGAGKLTSGPPTLGAGLIARVRAAAGVSKAEGIVTASKLTVVGHSGRPIQHQRAVNELLTYPSDPAVAAEFTIRSGRPPARPWEALLDAATAEAQGYRPGDRIGVLTSTGLRTLTITGITGFYGAASPPADQAASFDAPTVLVVPATTAQLLAGLGGQFTQIDVRAALGLPAAVLTQRITRLLPAGLTAIPGREAAAQVAASAAGYLDTLREDLLALSAMVLLVAAFLITDTFDLLVTRRTREYALLRITGATRGQVLRSAMSEAAVLGAVSSAVGIGLGGLAAVGLRGVVSLFGGSLPSAGLVLTPPVVAVALLSGTVVTVASALRPARLAAMVAPVPALAMALPVVRRPRRVLVAAAVTLAAGLGLIFAGLLSGTGQGPGLTAVGAVGLAAASVIAAPLLAGPVARLLAVASAGQRRSRCRRGGAVAIGLARDNMAVSSGRTATVGAILVVGLAAAAAVSVISTSARSAGQRAVSATSNASLYLQGIITPRLAAQVGALPGVSAIMRIDDPMVQVAGGPARVDGIDAGTAARLLNYGVPSRTLAALRGNDLLVSVAQAASHHWHPGSRVTVDFGVGAPVVMTMTGTFGDKQFLGDDYLMPISTLFRDMPDQLGQASLLLILTAPDARLRALRAAITGLTAADPQDTVQTRIQYLRVRAADFGDLSHALGLFTLLFALTDLIATLGIANALALSIAERTRELAVLRALGLTRAQLAAMIGAEAVTMCLVGAVPGVVAGTAGGAAFAAALTKSQAGVATIAAAPAQLAGAVVIACLAAVVAAVLPGRRAGRVPVLAAMRE